MAEYNEHIDRELFEHIEAYILNRMEPAARAAFEAEMERDESLRNEVALQRKLVGAVEVLSYTGAPAADTKIAPVKKISRAWLYGAAAAATVLVVVLLRFFSVPSPSADSLFAGVFEADPGLPVVMSIGKDHYDLYDGMVSYKEQDYTRALSIWKNISTPSDTLAYYTGMAHLNSGNTTAAIEYLEPIAGDHNSPWQQRAIWYLALAHLKENNTTAALGWLNRLPDNEQAKRLKEDIENL